MEVRKIVASLLLGTTALTAVEIEREWLESRAVQHPIAQADQRFQVTFGRPDHGPERGTHGFDTYRGVQTVITTPSANQWIKFPFETNSSEGNVKPVVISSWIR